MTPSDKEEETKSKQRSGSVSSTQNHKTRRQTSNTAKCKPKQPQQQKKKGTKMWGKMPQNHQLTRGKISIRTKAARSEQNCKQVRPRLPPGPELLHAGNLKPGCAGKNAPKHRGNTQIQTPAKGGKNEKEKRGGGGEERGGVGNRKEQKKKIGLLEMYSPSGSKMWREKWECGSKDSMAVRAGTRCLFSRCQPPVLSCDSSGSHFQQ